MADTELQIILDAQWDALASRSNHVRAIRRKLSEHLASLATVRQQDASAQLDEAQKIKHLQKQFDEWQAQNTEVNSRLIELRTGTLSQELSSTRQELGEIEKRRANLLARERDLSSVLESRCAPLEEYLRNFSSTKPPDPSSYGEKLSLLEHAHHVAKKESQAAADGLVLWEDVCTELSDLDDSIKHTSLDQIPFMVTQKIGILSRLRDQASVRNWNVLVVAIGHELIILAQLAEAIRDRTRGGDI